MKGIVIYDSSFGNTRNIAEAISETLKTSGIEVDSVYVKKVKELRANDYNFLVLGSPTRFGTMSFTMKGFLEKMNSEQWLNKPFAAFDTELLNNIEKGEGSAAEKISIKLREKQMKQLLPVLKAVVLKIRGVSLKEGEIERAKEYARTLAIEIIR
jgi:menaquinone-dependent protoporphyrinogen IX oxidase